MQEAAVQYAELGYKVFPLTAGLKRPDGVLASHGVHDATADLEKIKHWFTQEPSANIGLACEGLIVIDCDVGHKWAGFQRLEEENTCPVQNTPRGGLHFVFRRPEGKSWGNSQSRVAVKIDTRTDGGYIVAEPSHTIDCPEENTVEGDYYFDRPLPPFDELPYPPDWLVEELDAAFAPKPVSVTKPVDLAPYRKTDVTKRAIAYMDACPQAISGQKGHDQTFSVTQSLVNGFCLEPDTALRLLRDYYNPRCEPPWSEKQLQHKVDEALKTEPKKPIGWLLAERPSEDGPQADITALVSQATQGCHDREYGDLGEEDDEGEDIVSETPNPGRFPDHLLHVPGFIGEMSRYIVETNHTFQPVLALAGSLAFQGFLGGRKVCDPSNTRTNIYVLGMAETCCGKERARTVCKDLLSEHSERAKAMFFERPASYQGVQKKVFRQPQCILLWDEIGQSLRTYRKADGSPHLAGIMRTVTEMYTSAGSVYCSDTHSDERHDFTVVQPNLVVYGTSTPNELFAGLTHDSIKNGFCGRMILFEGDNDPDDTDQNELPAPPKQLMETLDKWLTFMPPGNDLNTMIPKPLILPRTAEAKAVFGDLRQQQREARRHDDPAHRALWGRAVQKASQLALIHACSKYGPDQRRLQIDQEAAQWACEVVRHTTRHILHLTSKWIADDDFHDKQNEVVRYVQEQGGAVNKNKITRRFHRWSIRVRNEVLLNLLATKQLVEDRGPKSGRGIWYYTPTAHRRTVNEPSTRC